MVLTIKRLHNNASSPVPVVVAVNDPVPSHQSHGYSLLVAALVGLIVYLALDLLSARGLSGAPSLAATSPTALFAVSAVAVEQTASSANASAPTVARGSSAVVPPNISAFARGLTIAWGILGAANLTRARAIPLLETSLASENNVFYFLEKNETNYAAARELREWVVQHGRTSSVEVVLLEPIADMTASIRNAWADLPVLKHMMTERPDADWYAIIDDDTYVLTAGARSILGEYETNMSFPLYLGDELTWGTGGGMRLVKNSRTGQKTVIPSSKRAPVPFVCGGAGIFVNQAAAKKVSLHLRRCMAKFFHPAGDIRLGACMKQADVPITRRREFIKDIWFRAIGELKPMTFKQRFPASFHRLRTADHFQDLRRVELSRGGDVVRWRDLEEGFPVGGKYFHALFFPKTYANYTTAYGIRTMVPLSASKIRGYKKWGIPIERGNPQGDEW